MPAAFIYLLKLSVSLGVVFLFYQMVLRRLTFYNWNRWYLMGYTVLSFFIPFIDISPALQHDEGNNTNFLQWVPTLYTHSAADQTVQESGSIAWRIVSLFIIAGIAVMLIRLIIQLISFRGMMKKAKLISGSSINLYQVDESIIPFSFGNAVFINKDLHTAEELEEIIRHEFVHVKQRHSIDIILSEILCLLNWYNPFAWMLRSAIRQNLEFVADNKVLANGINKKQYQYLLLKVIGNNQFSIAQKFNFSSLKKRIAMMNKNKSAKMHLLRFLFVLPVLALILVSFRKEIGETLTGKQKHSPLPPPVKTITDRAPVFIVTDTVPTVTEPNDKGYIINIIGVKSNRTVVVKDKAGKEVKRLLLTEWDANEEKYENMYGELPSPPAPPPPPAIMIAPTPPTPPTTPAPVQLPENVQKINVNNGKATVWLKNGQKENYDLNKADEKQKFEKKYGDVVPPPPPTPVAAGGNDNISIVSDEYDISDKKAVLHLRNGKTEVYDLTNKEQRSAFEKKYGKIINVNTSTDVNTNVDASSVIKIDNAADVNVITPVAAKASVHTGTTVIAPVANGMNVLSGNVIIADKFGYTITGDEDVLVTITKNTTKEELEAYKIKMKEKGITLSYDDMDYENGKLVKLTGTMKSKDSNSNFVAVDFDTLILAMIRNGEKTWFKVSVKDKKRVVI